MTHVAIDSPDGTKSVLMVYDGESRFGPAFFHATASGFLWPSKLTSATIGEDVHWSPDSRYIVVLVFHSRDSSKPPNVELVAIETLTGGLYSIDSNSRGLIRQNGFTVSGKYEYQWVGSEGATAKSWIAPKLG